MDDHAIRYEDTPHPLAALMPEMDGQDYARLRADIKANGQHEPIVIYERKVLDGYHRLRACRQEGIEPKVRSWTDADGSPLAYVISANVSRRHLTKSQRAVIALSLMPELHRQAKERQREHGDTAPGHPASDADASRTASGEAAQLTGVSSSLIEQAEQLQRLAPDRLPSVLNGDIPIGQALALVHAQRDRDRLAEPGNDLYPVFLIPPRAERFDVLVVGLPPGGLDALDPKLESWLLTLAAPDCHLYIAVTPQAHIETLALFRRLGFQYERLIVLLQPPTADSSEWQGRRHHMAPLLDGRTLDLVLVGRRGYVPLAGRKIKQVWLAATLRSSDFHALVEGFSTPARPIGVTTRSAYGYLHSGNPFTRRCAIGIAGERRGWTFLNYDGSPVAPAMLALGPGDSEPEAET